MAEKKDWLSPGLRQRETISAAKLFHKLAQQFDDENYRKRAVANARLKMALRVGDELKASEQRAILAQLDEAESKNG